MPVVTLPSGVSFPVELGASILHAASQAHIALPYSCKTGRCSTCKCKVVSGMTTPLHAESGLTGQEKTEGWILSCVRSAETDVVLEVDDLGGVKLPAVKTLPCRISQIKRLATDVIQVLLRLPPTAEFSFIPGQYIDVIGPNSVRRSYSLASANFVDKVLELHIRAVEAGAMSLYWFNQAKVNDLLRLNGPLGTFFLRETADVDVIFLATGTGIAPVKAMLEAIARTPKEQAPKSVTVLWGGRRPQDFYLNLADISGGHAFVPVQSRPDEAWSGAKGYVQDVLLDLVPVLKNAAVYACGSDAMIHSAKKRLVDAGLPPKRFYSDAFVCSGTN
ncbi:MAG: 2Fe-2S iron-sulfur cluster binding domain-containing protein [Nevskiaceae bacterium]|nr:MAG: 2Fe-2S iron-sulfur cluster binding domain-containing protein [Nevskiaceae bacterium]